MSREKSAMFPKEIVTMRAAAVFIGLLCIACASAYAVEKKLIEFGWDEPGTAFMREHAEEMDRSPFDG